MEGGLFVRWGKPSQRGEQDSAGVSIMASLGAILTKNVRLSRAMGYAVSTSSSFRAWSQ